MKKVLIAILTSCLAATTLDAYKVTLKIKPIQGFRFDATYLKSLFKPTEHTQLPATIDAINVCPHFETEWPEYLKNNPEKSDSKFFAEESAKSISLEINGINFTQAGPLFRPIDTRPGRDLDKDITLMIDCDATNLDKYLKGIEISSNPCAITEVK